MTDSIKKALSETERRRNIQLEYNKKHNITPTSIRKSLNSIFASVYEKDSPVLSLKEDQEELSPEKTDKIIKQMKKQMLIHASNLEFEKAAKIRDQINKIEQNAVLRG